MDACSFKNCNDTDAVILWLCVSEPGKAYGNEAVKVASLIIVIHVLYKCRLETSLQIKLQML